MHDVTNLQPGRIVIIDGKQWMRCAKCGKIIRIDKPLFGSLHICAGENDG